MVAVRARTQHRIRPPVDRAGVVRRLWAAPLLVHAGVLAAVLAGVAAYIGTGASWSSDEGAAILQAHALLLHHSWTVPELFSKVDPAHHAYPVALSQPGTLGFAPFGKHLTYAVMLAVAAGIVGTPGMVGLSVLAAVAAAVLAARLSSHIRPGLERVTLWTLGLASPLLFDANLVIAHTLGAALIVGAVLLALRFLRGRSVWTLAGVAGCLMVGALVRNEAVLFGAGMGAASGLLALRRRGVPSRPRALALAVAAVGAVAVAHELDAVMTVAAIGPAPRAVGPPAAAGAVGTTGILSHVQSFALTWLVPTYNYGNHLSAVLVVTVLAGLAGAFLVRRRPGDSGGIMLMVGLSVAVVVVRLLADPAGGVPGLAVAFPVLWVGLWLIRGELLGQHLAAYLATVSALVFGLGVVYLQYTEGGAAEWGGRYFAIALPVIVPVALEAIRRSGIRLAPTARAVALAGLVVISAGMGTMAVAQLHTGHLQTAQLEALAASAGRSIAGPGQRPVMVTTQALVPRMAWQSFDAQRWLLVPLGQLAAYGPRLAQAGVQRLVLVSQARSHDLADLAGSYRLVSARHPASLASWTVAVLAARP